MVTLEQIKLLESKITRAVNFVVQVTEENSRLKKRNTELEGIIEKLREEKNKVEEGIVSALGKLNQFEDAIERSLSSAKSNSKPVKEEAPVQQAAPAQQADPAKQQAASAQQAAPTQQAAPVQQAAAPVKPAIPSAYTVNEETEEDSEAMDEIEDSGEAELDIF